MKSETKDRFGLTADGRIEIVCVIPSSLFGKYCYYSENYWTSFLPFAQFENDCVCKSSAVA